MIFNCRSCDALIVFLKTKNGKPMPVNMAPTDKAFRAPTKDETEFVYGEHQSHFITCPNAKEHRK